MWSHSFVKVSLSYLHFHPFVAEVSFDTFFTFGSFDFQKIIFTTL